MTTERPLGSSYVLEDVIGRGAMGQVWRGRDRDGHPLAFKLLRPELAEDPKVVQRFVQERSILTSIKHPNVVSMRDLVVEGDTLAIVMDLVVGGDLRALLSGPRTLPPARVAELGVGIAAGLAAVHAAGVVHRDVKPENVLVDASSNPGRPRLTDFGIAKHVRQEGTSRRSTMLVGTPQYIAPELVDGQEPTTASDLYGLGIMLYELVCGVTPFAGGSTLAVLRNQAERFPGRPPMIPDSLWDLISWLLGKHPTSRPQSASQVATLLDALVPELVGLPAAQALHEPPEPEPSVHTQLTEMAPRPVTARAAVPSVPPGGLDAGHSTTAPRTRSPGRRPVMIVGALTGVLLLAGSGLAAAKMMAGSDESQSKTSSTSQASRAQPAITPAGGQTPIQEQAQAQTQVPAQVPSQAQTQVPAQVPSQAQTQEPAQVPSQVPSQEPAEATTPLLDPEAEALATLNQQRAADLIRAPMNGQWVAMLSSKYDGIDDPLQTTASGSHIFHNVDILDEFRRLQSLDLGGADVILLLSTDYGTRHTSSGRALWVTFALPELSSGNDTRSWCSTYFAPLTGQALLNACAARQLNPPS